MIDVGVTVPAGPESGQTLSDYAKRFVTPEQSQRLRELRTPLEPLRTAMRAPALLTAPRGDGRALMAIPGFGVSDISLAPLRGFLASRGHRPHGWNQGVNRGDVEGLLEPCIERVEELVAKSGRPANLVGWSLGGVFVREIARDRPDLVHRIATLGTPLYGPRHTLTRRAYSDEQLANIEAQLDERADVPITAPILAVYSPNDGVVDWRACIEELTPGARNLEVASSHFGIGIDPDVWRALAEWFSAN